VPRAESDYDVIVVGSGACGATVTRELARHNKKVLLLEQGDDSPVKETMSGIAAVVKEFDVGHELKAITAATVGGSTSLYFGLCKLPTAATFAKFGIDLSRELEELKQELPIAELPEDFLAPQSIKLRDSARALGYLMKPNPLLVDQSKCVRRGYSYEAKWKARSYVADAVSHGAKLTAGAAVGKVIVERGRAVGVEYQRKKRFGGYKAHQAYAKKIVLCAGSFATPKLLIDCGIKNVGDRGFFCKPSYMVCGTVPGLKGTDAFVGSLDCDLGDGVSIGDGAMSEAVFRAVMLANFKWRLLFSHRSALAIGVLMNDELGGEIKEDGRYDKQLTPEELAKLRKAGDIAVKILESAGARNIFRTRLVGGNPGGVLRIHEHLDENLQTQISNLHVCDHSVMADANVTPTVPLICLSKYLARRLLLSL